MVANVPRMSGGEQADLAAGRWHSAKRSANEGGDERRLAASQSTTMLAHVTMVSHATMLIITA